MSGHLLKGSSMKCVYKREISTIMPEKLNSLWRDYSIYRKRSDVGRGYLRHYLH